MAVVTPLSQMQHPGSPPVLPSPACGCTWSPDLQRQARGQTQCSEVILASLRTMSARTAATHWSLIMYKSQVLTLRNLLISVISVK